MTKEDADGLFLSKVIAISVGILVVMIILGLCCQGCNTSPKSNLEINLVEGILTSEKENTEIDIGSIEYSERTDPNGVSTISITVQSFKVTEAKLAMEKEKAMVETMNNLIVLTNTLMIGGGI